MNVFRVTVTRDNAMASRFTLVCEAHSAGDAEFDIAQLCGRAPVIKVRNIEATLIYEKRAGARLLCDAAGAQAASGRS